MSADNGWVIRRKDNGKYVLHGYFASDDNYPTISASDLEYNTLEDAVNAFIDSEDSEYPSEYGLSIRIKI
jgi:hypothetical protein